MQVINWTISVYNISQAIVVLFIGVISDLWGRRATFMLCLALHIIGTIWIALSSSISWMIAMRVLQAIGSAAAYIILRLIIKDTMDKKAQIHATGLLVMGLVLSPILAPVIGAWIIRLSNWRNCFWALTVLELPLFFWSWLTIVETNRQQVEFRKTFSWKRHINNYIVVLMDPYFLGMALIVGAAFAAFYSFISISSFLYIDQFGIAETTYAYIFIGIALSYLLGNRLMSTLNANNLPPQQIIRYGIFLSIAGTACILSELLARNSLAIVLLVTTGTYLLRLATALINPPAQVAVTNYFNDKGSHALGLLTCAQYAFAAFGTMVVSGLPMSPNVNFMVSTTLFVLLATIGYGFAFERQITQELINE